MMDYALTLLLLAALGFSAGLLVGKKVVDKPKNKVERAGSEAPKGMF